MSGTAVSMTDERALEISAAMADAYFVSEGLSPFSGTEFDLAGASLGEMVEAARIAREITSRNAAAGKAFCAVPDDRLVAAIYAAIHYDPSASPVFCIASKAVSVRQAV